MIKYREFIRNTSKYFKEGIVEVEAGDGGVWAVSIRRKEVSKAVYEIKCRCDIKFGDKFCPMHGMKGGS